MITEMITKSKEEYLSELEKSKQEGFVQGMKDGYYKAEAYLKSQREFYRALPIGFVAGLIAVILVQKLLHII